MKASGLAAPEVRPLQRKWARPKDAKKAARLADERDCEALIEAIQALAEHWGVANRDDCSPGSVSPRPSRQNGVDREILIKGLAPFSGEEQAQILSAAKTEHWRRKRDVIQIVKKELLPVLSDREAARIIHDAAWARHLGSPREQRVREYLINELRDLGKFPTEERIRKLFNE